MSAKEFLEKQGLPLGETFDDCDLTWDSVIAFMDGYKATEVAAYRARLLEKVDKLDGTFPDESLQIKAAFRYVRDLITKTE